MSTEEPSVQEEQGSEQHEPLGSNGKGSPHAVEPGREDMANGERPMEEPREPERRQGKQRTRRKGRTRRRLKQATQAAHVLANRQDYVAQGLSLLHNLGVLDKAAHDRLVARYQEGDEATRRLLREQVERILAGARQGQRPAEERAGADAAPPAPEQIDPQRIQRGEVEVLQTLASEQVDVHEVANYVQHLDPVRWLGDPKHPGALMRFFSEVPLVVHRFQRRVFWSGIFMIAFAALLVATAITVPAIVPYVGVGGVVLLALLFGYWLLRGSIWVDRAVKKQGIDLDVYARLPDDERRLLLIRRIGMRVVDPEKLGAALERGLHGPGHAPVAKKRSFPAQAQPRPVAPEQKPIVQENDLAPDEASGPDQENASQPEESEQPPSSQPSAAQDQDGRLKRVLEFTRDMIDRTVGPRENAKQTAKEVGHELADGAKQAGHQLDEARQRGQQKWEEHRAQRVQAEAAPRKSVKRAAKKRSARKATAKKATGKKTAAKKTAAKKKSGNQTGVGKKRTARKGPTPSRKKTTGKGAKKSAKKGSRRPTKKGAAKKAGAKKGSRKGKKRSGQRRR